MKNKIYEEIKRKNLESSRHYAKVMNLIDDDNQIKLYSPQKNIDLINILSNIGLIEKTEENISKLNEFYEYLTKLGIETGVDNGKREVIDAIKNGKVDFEELLKIDCEKFTDYSFKPTFIKDLQDVFVNDK